MRGGMQVRLAPGSEESGQLISMTTLRKPKPSITSTKAVTQSPPQLLPSDTVSPLESGPAHSAQATPPTATQTRPKQ